MVACGPRAARRNGGGSVGRTIGLAHPHAGHWSAYLGANDDGARDGNADKRADVAVTIRCTDGHGHGHPNGLPDHSTHIKRTAPGPDRWANDASSNCARGNVFTDARPGNPDHYVMVSICSNNRDDRRVAVARCGRDGADRRSDGRVWSELRHEEL